MIEDEFDGRKREGKFAHFCYEWDDLLIDENDSEFMSCLCFRNDDLSKEEVKAIQERMWQEYEKKAWQSGQSN